MAGMQSERLEPRWPGAQVIVAGSGPSLTQEAADLCRGQRVIAVNDAYRLMPWADVLYACDAKWWDEHDGCRSFAGERWTSYHEGRRAHVEAVVRKYKLRVCLGAKVDLFSTDPAHIHYGRNSGFQAMNLAMLWGATRLLLVGFNFRMVGSAKHFFGSHPRGVESGSNYPSWVKAMHHAAKHLPPHITVINCTPDSAIKCFPVGNLREVLHGTQIDNAA